MNNCELVEHFSTIQGEGRYMGYPSYFIRLGGCHLRCKWCDSKYTWKTKNKKQLDVEKFCNTYVLPFKGRHVVITGGEPLLKDNWKTLREFVDYLVPKDFKITIETTMFWKFDQLINSDVVECIEDINDLFGSNSDGVLYSIAPKFEFKSYKKTDEEYLRDFHITRFYRLDNSSWEDITKFKHNAYYKIVYDTKNKDIIDKFIVDNLPEEVRCSNSMYLMPLTPIPYYTDEEYKINCNITAEACKKYNIIYTPRIHQDIWGLKRGI